MRDFYFKIFYFILFILFILISVKSSSSKNHKEYDPYLCAINGYESDCKTKKPLDYFKESML